MNLEARINEEMKAAMKSGDKLRLETMRSLRAGIISFNKSGAGREMNDEDEQKILLAAAKQRRDAIELSKSAGRPEFIEREEAELAIIQEFLPKQLSEEEVKNSIQKIITETGATGAKDFGKVIGAAMKELRGKAEGALVQQLVKQLLA